MAVLVTLVGAASLVTPFPVSGALAASIPGPVLGPACPDVMVIAARGSGEQPQPGGPHGSWSNPAAYTFKDTFYGVGEFNYKVYSALKTADSKLRFSLDPVRYPADPALEAVTDYPTYEASAAAGASSIVTEIARTRAACGDQVRFVLAGYSQGAWSVHRALYALQAQNDGSLGRISAVALFGDPEFRPGQVIDRGSQNGLVNSGLATPVDVSSRNVPTSLRTKTASYCLPRDPICQGISPISGLAAGATYLAHCWAVNWAPGKCPHTSYLVSGATAQAASFASPLMPKTTLWPHLSLTAPPDGTVGNPYSWTATAAPPGSYTWKTTPSLLPPGLNFTTAGTLTGTPTQAGTYTFLLTATDQYGRYATGQATITINPSSSGNPGTWTAVSTGGSSTCAIATNGTLWCWGGNGYGKLGTGDTNPRLTPTQVVGTATDWATISVADADNTATCATRTDGTLWCWGDNTVGELGTGDTNGRLIPSQVGTATDWATVSTAAGSTCATRTDGTLWCWGQDLIGTSESLTPVQVDTATDSATVSVSGYGDACATRTDRTLWCWGENFNGELGTGDTSPRITPTQVGTATNWATVSLLDLTTCATRTDGTLWCWGSNGNGAVGTGDQNDRWTPTQVGTASNWATVSATAANTCATRTDGTLWCWGNNYSGALGVGENFGIVLTPLKVGTATGWSTVFTEGGSSFAIRTDGTMWCWGDNTWGQLGTGDTTNHWTPTQLG